ncbi:MAG: hypothetical protein IJ037_06260 [Clostridia bacterium]|nr:hypothetical protein [Clostridia bacterium]
MHPLAEEYLKSKSAQPDSDSRGQEIRDFLIGEGLYEIQYSPYPYATDDYPLFDADKNRSYRIEPIPVTYEEYLKLYNAREESRQEQKCKAASRIQTAAYTVCLLGALIGILYLGWAPFIWLATLISGTTLFALSKIIDQLHQIQHQEKQK